MNTQTNTRQNWLPGLFLGVTVLIVAVLFMLFFMWLPTEGTSLGIDLLMSAFDGGTIHYRPIFGLLNPPWSMLPLIPLGLIPDKAGWGLLVFILICILILSVPRQRNRLLYWFQILLLVTSFPALRVMADAQVEGIVIAGLLLTYVAFQHEKPVLMAIGLLLATAKPQAVHIYMLILGLYILHAWQFRRWLTTGLIAGSVVLLTLLWKGAEWWVAINNFQFTNTLIDISLSGAMDRLGVPGPLAVIIWAITGIFALLLMWFSRRDVSRIKIMFLVSTSMLLAPYTGGNTILIPLAVGVIPLMNKHPLQGILLFVLIDAGYFLNRGDLRDVYAYYWTVVLLLMWALAAFDIYRTEIAHQHNTPDAVRLENTA